MNLHRNVQRFLDLPLRMKFVLSFLVVILFGGLVSLFFGTRLVHNRHNHRPSGLPPRRFYFPPPDGNSG